MEKKYKIKFADTINQIKRTYFAVGLWKTNNFLVFISQAFYFMLISSIIASVMVEAFTTDKKDEPVFLTVTALIAVLQVYRIYYVISKQPKILALLDPVSVNSTDNYETFCSADKKLNYLMKFARIWIYVSFLLFVFVATIPLVTKRLPFNIAFPFDYKTNDAAFWLAYVYVAGAFLLSVTLILFFVIIIWYMMLNLAVKYEILGNHLKNLGKIEESGTKSLSPEARQKFYICHLIEAIQSFENVNEYVVTTYCFN